ncbi:hypothetical protein CHARACLAT_033174 [Characodon lateralis]|uniref:Uncharacterized protein n=1 Tax=Characodon lateralis TaxID=208331 RepID=A0ABU7EPN7_9TELE|nr:hypothetical protein [Characodon lateralis]
MSLLVASTPLFLSIQSLHCKFYIVCIFRPSLWQDTTCHSKFLFFLYIHSFIVLSEIRSRMGNPDILLLSKTIHLILGDYKVLPSLKGFRIIQARSGFAPGFPAS